MVLQDLKIKSVVKEATPQAELAAAIKELVDIGTQRYLLARA